MNALDYFFSTKQERQYAERVEEGFKRLCAFRKVGQIFNYLGRTCLVRSHATFVGVLGWVPELQAEYADEMGMIHTLHFGESDLPALRSQNEA